MVSTPDLMISLLHCLAKGRSQNWQPTKQWLMEILLEEAKNHPDLFGRFVGDNGHPSQELEEALSRLENDHYITKPDGEGRFWISDIVKGGNGVFILQRLYWDDRLQIAEVAQRAAAKSTRVRG